MSAGTARKGTISSGAPAKHVQEGGFGSARGWFAGCEVLGRGVRLAGGTRDRALCHGSGEESGGTSRQTNSKPSQQEKLNPQGIAGKPSQGSQTPGGSDRGWDALHSPALQVMPCCVERCIAPTAAVLSTAPRPRTEPG